MQEGICVYNRIWATSRENLFLPYANSKGADQLAQPGSLISAFVIRCLDSTLYNICSFYMQNLKPLASLYSWVGDLSLTWSEIPKTDFLMTWLIWSVHNVNIYFDYRLSKQTLWNSISVLDFVWTAAMILCRWAISSLYRRRTSHYRENLPMTTPMKYQVP